MRKTTKTILLTAVLFAATFHSCEKPTDIPEEQTNEITAETPRYLAAADGYVYASCYNPHCVVRIDTSELRITALCTLGGYYPEGLCAIGGKLYVASNSIADERSVRTYDNKLYVVDLSTFTVKDSFTVGLNPSKVAVLNDNCISLNYWGNYKDIPAGTMIMNTSTKEITNLPVALYNYDVYDGDIYGYTSPYGSLSFYRIDGRTLQAEKILTEWPKGVSPYGIKVNEHNGDIIVLTDGMYSSAGDCYIFTNTGTLRCEPLEMDILPSKVHCIDADHLLVLNEGLWGENNAEISMVDIPNKKVTTNWFSSTNQRGLGDVGQDMLKYGSRIYTTVSFSNSIEVINPSTGKSKRIATAK